MTEFKLFVHKLQDLNFDSYFSPVVKGQASSNHLGKSISCSKQYGNYCDISVITKLHTPIYKKFQFETPQLAKEPWPHLETDITKVGLKPRHTSATSIAAITDALQLINPKVSDTINDKNDTN